MTSTLQPLLEARDLNKTFGHGNASVKAVDGISLTIRRGELVMIMGPSGSGKTTLLSMLGALLRPDSGEIFIDGTRIDQLPDRKLASFRARRMGFIFQAFNLLGALTVRENILFPARFGVGLTADIQARAERLIQDLGLTHRVNALPSQLSGGEKQRVAIARALINDPPLILADEPTGNLDSARGQEVMMTLHDIARDEGKSVLIVTHDPRVEDVADRVLWLEDGAIRDRKRENHIWVTDPVCGMRVDRDRSLHQAKHKGEIFFFCSQRCVDRFNRNTDSYLGRLMENQHEHLTTADHDSTSK
jgi:putative ABC transport system ATP-binding protein